MREIAVEAVSFLKPRKVQFCAVQWDPDVAYFVSLTYSVASYVFTSVVQLSSCGHIAVHQDFALWRYATTVDFLSIHPLNSHSPQ